MVDRFFGLFKPAPLSESIKLYLSANAVLRATGIGRGIILTWLMISPAEFGSYQIGLLFVNVLLPVLSLGSYEGIARFVPEYEAKRQLWHYLRATIPFCLAVGICLSGLLFALAGPACELLFGSPLTAGAEAGDTPAAATSRVQLARLVAACVATLIVYHLILGVLRGRRMFLAVSSMELTAGIVFTVLAVTAALLGRGSGVVILGIYTAANFLTAVVFGVAALWLVRRDSSSPIKTVPASDLKFLIRFGFWAGWGAFFWQLLLLFPAMYLNRVCGETVLATYRAITILAQIGYIIPAAVAVAVASAVNATWETSSEERALEQLNISTKTVLAAVLVLSLLFAALKGLIVLAFPAEYRAGADLVPLLLLFYLIAGALGLVTIRFILIKKSLLTFLCWAVGCSVAVGLSAAGVTGDDPLRALRMTAWANVGGALAALAVAGFLLGSRRLLPDRGTCILLAGAWLLLATPSVNIAAALAIILLSTSTALIFTRAERQVLLRHALHMLNFKSSFPGTGGSDNQQHA